VFGEETPEVSVADREAVGQALLGAGVERAVEDELHRPAYQLGPDLAERLGDPVRPATQAGSEARGLGGRGVLEVPDVLGVRTTAAVRAAVDARRHDRREALHTFMVGPPGPDYRTDPDRCSGLSGG
jgi:hypothetical protein